MQEEAPVSGLTTSPRIPPEWTSKGSEAVTLVVSRDSPRPMSDVSRALALPCACLSTACRWVKCLGGVGNITGVDVPLIGEQR